MGALYPVKRNLWATALCLLLIPVPGIETFQNANFSRSQAQGTNLYFRVKGKWRLVHHHASPITVRVGEAL